MIKTLTIKNYACHKNTSIDLGPFNVFVGPSNSGKSSAFDALLAISNIARTHVGMPFGAGPYGFNFTVRHNANPKTIGLKLDYEEAGNYKQQSYEIEIRQYKGSIHFHEERVTTEGDVVCERSKGIPVNINSSDDSFFHQSRELEGGEPQVSKSFFSCLRHIFKYRFFTNELKSPNAFNSTSAWVSYEGNGLASSFYNLTQNDRPLLADIENDIRRVFPQFDSLRINTMGQQDVGWNAVWKNGNLTPAPKLSDGFAQYVGLITMLRILKSQFKDATVMLEEPDLSLDTRAMNGLIDFLVSWVSDPSSNNSLILTTHNPYFLRCIWRSRKELFLDECKYFSLDKERCAKIISLADLRNTNHFDTSSPSIGICADILDGTTIND